MKQESFHIADFATQKGLRLHLDVIYQEVVVHSIKNWEAGVAKQQLEQEIEWTTTIMPD